ncbi:DUF1648 domain-containing protein [bacterium]|nr:DUF1648 domain-containing protein [bacterium]
MKNATVILLVLLVLLIGGALQFRHYYPLMPDPMATHFGVNMQADAWTAKASFFTIYSLVEIGMLVVLLMPIFFQKRIPTSLINLPHRDYWFAAERREATWQTVSTYALWMAAATLAFLIALAEVMFRANLANVAAPSIGAPFFWTLGIYLGIIAVATIWFYRRFATVPRDPGTAPVPE